MRCGRQNKPARWRLPACKASHNRTEVPAVGLQASKGPSAPLQANPLFPRIPRTSLDFKTRMWGRVSSIVCLRRKPSTPCGSQHVSSPGSGEEDLAMLDIVIFSNRLDLLTQSVAIKFSKVCSLVHGNSFGLLCCQPMTPQYTAISKLSPGIFLRKEMMMSMNANE